MKTSRSMRVVKLKPSFAFVAHYVELWNWLLNFRMFGFLHRHPEWRWALYPFYPLCFLASVWYLFGKKPFNVVDTFEVSDCQGRVIRGHTILVRNFAWHFLLARYFPKIRERILQAALYAQNILKVDTVGLGALNKAEWLTRGGLWLTEQDAIDVKKVRVVHGDTATAWFVSEHLESMCGPRHGHIAVIGPTSKIGRAVILRLVERGYIIRAYTDSAERFNAIRSEIPARYRMYLIRADSLDELKLCSCWLIGKAKPRGSILLRYIPKEALVLNFSVPDPLTPSHLKRRGDIRHFDSGLATLPGHCTMRFAMRLKVKQDKDGKGGVEGSMYACWIGTLIHTILDWEQHEVGEVKLDELRQVGDEAKRLGIKLPPPTSHLRSF